MAFDVDALTDYSFAEIKKAAKHAMLAAIFGGATLTIQGRALGRVTTDQAKALYDWADAQETAGGTGASGAGGGIALGRFGDAV